MNAVIELHQKRKSMRDRRLEAMRKSPIAMLDIGSSRIAVLVVQYFQPKTSEHKDWGIRVLSSFIIQSHGVRFGEIVNRQLFESDLMRCFRKAQAEVGARIDYAVVSFSGGRPQSYGIVGEAEVAMGEVTSQDIAQAIMNGEMPDLGVGREWLHAMPINFSLDHQTGLRDPRGHIGVNLAVDMHYLSVEKSVYDHIDSMLQRLGVHMTGITHGAYAAGLAVLSEDAQERGAMVIDFGAQTTSIAIFLHKQLIYVGSVRIGGDHVTRDISLALDMELDEAETLKTRHGGCVAMGVDDREQIEINTKQAGERLYITRAELIGIIRPRMEEILEEVAQLLEEDQVHQIPINRTVITGGASQIEGLIEIAEHFLGRRISLGQAVRLAGASAAQTQPSYAAVTGLVLHNSHPCDEIGDFDLIETKQKYLSPLRIFRWFRARW